MGTRRLIDEGKPGKRKLSEAQIESLGAFGFPWVPTFTPPSSFEDRFEELRARVGLGIITWSLDQHLPRHAAPYGYEYGVKW